MEKINSIFFTINNALIDKDRDLFLQKQPGHTHKDIQIFTYYIFLMKYWDTAVLVYSIIVVQSLSVTVVSW